MREFFQLQTVARARHILFQAYSQELPRTEGVPLREALGRVLATPIWSPEDVPPYSRSTVDGYAVRSQDTFGASESMPAMLSLVEDIAMGSVPKLAIDSGQASAIPTGGALPEGADACVMVENTSFLGEGMVLVYAPASPGENVVEKGEDIKEGDLVFPAGHYLRPSDVGALSALGITSVPVQSKVKIAIISTGDEIVDPGATPQGGQIRDVNAYSLWAAAQAIGAEPIDMGISKDTYPELHSLVEKALPQADIVVISGGSSVGERDVVARVVDDLGPPGVLVHGVAVKPGKPIIIGICQGKPVFGLPGHPVSALLAFDLFVRFIVGKMGAAGDRGIDASETWVEAKLGRSMASFPGRQVSVQVRLVWDGDELWAEPVLGKSGLISTLTRADGEIIIPEDSEGVLMGSQVRVRLWEGYKEIAGYERALVRKDS